MLDHLKQRGLVHSASIFLPESHMTHKVISRTDLAKVRQKETQQWPQGRKGPCWL